MLRPALWCVLSLAASGCTLIGEGELDDKPSEGAGGAAASTTTTGVVGGATASNGSEATTSTGPGPGPGPGAGPGGGGPGREPACLPGSVCQGSSCVCGSPKAPEADGCPAECNAGCDENKGVCRIERDGECNGSCPETIACPPGMECEYPLQGHEGLLRSDDRVSRDLRMQGRVRRLPGLQVVPPRSAPPVR